MNDLTSACKQLVYALLIAVQLVTCCFGAIGKATPKKPNIVFILADDLGWNDVDWHDPTLHSPHLNSLAHGPHSAQLNFAYVNQLCSPTRSALLSGYYPFHLGTQHGTFWWMEPTGVPVKYSFFPERLQDQGYGTYMVGKWHIGYCKHDFLPTRRGFDKFRGYYCGLEDYYKHGMFNTRGFNFTGLDFWEDTPDSFKADWNQFEQYSTEVYANESVKMLQQHDKAKPFFLYLAFQAVHNPMQAPDKYLVDCAHIEREERRIFCGMVNAMDQAVGKVVKELKTLGLYENTIIIFSSDNGGDTMWGGNNYPLRGNKDTLWEGGTRIVSFVHSPKYITVGGTRSKLFSIVDWYATILAMSGIDLDGYGDGFNYWPMIANNSNIFERKRLVYNVDGSTAAIREGQYKLIVGNPGRPADWVKPTESGKIGPPFNQTIWLFDISRDPLELRDLSRTKPRTVNRLLQKLKAIAATGSPDIHMPLDARGDPKRFNGTFASGWC
uniref:Sulfatase N-terminal domain-containing protein n=1 Tax=Plectus sambesii TaxID=2011161 RepID=A0A914WLD2_9BILA